MERLDAYLAVSMLGLSVDTNVLGLNHLYSYAEGNPISKVDPYGLLTSSSQGEKNDANVCMAGKSRCDKVRDSCILKCSAVLPTKDYGASFRVCLNKCMVDAGCNAPTGGGW